MNPRCGLFERLEVDVPKELMWKVSNKKVDDTKSRNRRSFGIKAEGLKKIGMAQLIRV